MKSNQSNSKAKRISGFISQEEYLQLRYLLMKNGETIQSFIRKAVLARIKQIKEP